MYSDGRVSVEIEKHLRVLSDSKFSDAARLAVQNVAECLKLAMSKDELAIVLQQLLSPTAPLSVLTQLRTFAPRKEFDLVRADLLKLVNEHLLPQVAHAVRPYASPLLAAVLRTIKLDTSGKAKEEAFATFVAVQRLQLDLARDPDYVEPAQFVKTFFDELGMAKSKQTQGVRGALLSTLGQLSDLYPSLFTPYAQRLADLYAITLEEQLTSSAKKEQKKLLEGVLIGMKSFLNNFAHLFPKDAKKKVQRLDFLFKCVKIGLLPEANATRYSTIRAALALLIRHSKLFSEYLCADAEEVLSLLMPACNHTNREVKTKATNALEAVLGRVAAHMVATKLSGGQATQKLFNTLLVYFNKKLESGTTEDIGIAIRAFGQLAKAIRAFMGEPELLKFFRKLLAMSERLYSGPIEAYGGTAAAVNATAAANAANAAAAAAASGAAAAAAPVVAPIAAPSASASLEYLPSFISAYASILHELSPAAVEVSVINYLAQVLGRFFLVFPNVVDARRYRNYNAITRLLVVLYTKGSLQHMLDRVVYQGLALTISKLPESSVSRRVAEQSSAAADNEAQGYVEYTFLWHNLLGLAQSLRKKTKRESKEADGIDAKATPVTPPWNEGLDLPLARCEEMQRMLFDQIISDVLRLLKTLDVRFKPKAAAPRIEPPKDGGKDDKEKAKDSKDAGAAGGAGPGSGGSDSDATSDLSTQYTPFVPKDYELYLNLVEFVRRFFLLPLEQSHESVRDPNAPSSSSASASASGAAAAAAGSDGDAAMAVVPAAAPGESGSTGVLTASTGVTDTAASATPLRLLSQWFRPWLALVSRELIELSAAHPLVSGFYKLLSVVFRVSDRFGYFSALPLGGGGAGSGASALLLTADDIKVKLELVDGDSAMADGGAPAAAAAAAGAAPKRGHSTAASRAKAAKAAKAAGSAGSAAAAAAAAAAADVVDLTRDAVAQGRDDTLDNRLFAYRVLLQFLHEVVTRLQTFRDELLFAAIELVLRIPREFIDIPLLLPALRKTLEIGRGFQPAALLGVAVLESWQHRMPAHLNQHLGSILPLLSAYLTRGAAAAAAAADEEEGSGATGSTAVGAGADSAAAVKKSRAEAAASMSAQSLVVGGSAVLSNDRAVTMRILQLLGRTGGAAQHVLAATQESDVALVWDPKQWISFPLPFKDKKIDVYLDSLLPRLCVLAETAVDRKTKVAACEALHSMVLYMVARQAMDPNRATEGAALRLVALYKRLFPVLLRLAVDVEQVARQLFDPLLRQLIHWLTNNARPEQQETMALLDACTDAVCSHTDGALREFSAQLLGEFVKWSLKHAPAAPAPKPAAGAAGALALPGADPNATNPMNVRSLLRRLYSLAHHPNPYKRLGACLTFNQIYRQFRESRDLCSRFTLDILYNLLYSLQLSERDDPSLGTRDAARRVIAHFERIVTDPSAARYRDLLKPISKTAAHSAQRAGNEHCRTLGAFVDWLWNSSGRLEEVSRRTAHDLFRAFAPLTSTTATALTAHGYMANWIKAKGVRALVGVMEGGGSVDTSMLAGAHASAAAAAAPAALAIGSGSGGDDNALRQRLWVAHGEDWVRASRLSAWFTSLGAALDAYRFALEGAHPLIPKQYLVAGVSNLFTSSRALKPEAASQSGSLMSDDTKYSGGGATDSQSVLMPAIQAFLNRVQSTELDTLAKSLSASAFIDFQAKKCAVAIRLFRFLSLCVRQHADSLGFVFAPIVDDPAFYSLLFGVLLNPEANGFSLTANPRRIRQLQAQCGSLLRHLYATAAGAVDAAAAARRKQILVKTGAALLRDPALDPAVQLRAQAMSNNVGFASALCNGYHELFSAGLLVALLTAGGKLTAPQLAAQLAEQSFALATAQSTPLSPLLRHVGMQLLSLSLHVGLPNDVLFGYLANATVVGPRSGSGGSSGSGSGGDAKGDSVAPALATASFLFYSSNRVVLDSYLVHSFTSFSKPLLRAIFVSRELFGVLLNVVQGLAASKAKAAAKLALAQAALASSGAAAAGPAAMAVDDGKAAKSKAAAAAAPPSDDAGWDAAAQVGTVGVADAAAAAAAAAAGAAGDDKDSSGGVGSSTVLMPGASAIHSAADSAAFVDELLRMLGPAFAGSGKNPKVPRQVAELARDDETLSLTLTLLERLLEVDSDKVLARAHPSTDLLLQSYLLALSGTGASVALKKQALSFIHWFVRRSPSTGAVLSAWADPIVRAVAVLVTCVPFPAKSTELARGSVVWHQYTALLDSLLHACVLSRSMPLLETLLPVVRERQHAHGSEIRRSTAAFLEAVCQPGAGAQVRDVLERALKIFSDRALDDSPLDNARFWVVAQIAAPLLRIAPMSVASDFFVAHAKELLKIIESKPNGPTVSKDLDQQQLEMGELECCYLLLEVLFRRLDKSVAERAGVVHKTLMQTCHTHLKKTGKQQGSVGAVSYLAFHCAAYNCLAAAVSRTQTVQKFFDGLCFAENTARGEILWENIVDTSAPLRFEIDTAFEIADAPIAFRTQKGTFNLNSAGGADSSKYLSSQYLANSSLSQDVTGAFFADAAPRLAAFNADEAKRAAAAAGGASMEDDDLSRSADAKDAKDVKSMSDDSGNGGGSDDMLDVAVHELDALNRNPSMPALLALIDHLQREFGARWSAAEMPEWMKALHTKLSASDTHINVKWFIAKLVVNRWMVFGRWSRAWFAPLVVLATLPADRNGGVGFHYFLRDLCYLFLSWRDVLAADATATDRDVASRFVAHLMRVAPDHGTSTTGKFGRLRDNLKWIKLLVERWRCKVTIDKLAIVEHLRAPIDKSSRTGGHGVMRRSVGLQLLAIVMANDYMPYDPHEDASIPEDKFLDAVMDNVMSEKKTLHAPAAEVYGMMLRAHTREKKSVTRDAMHKQYVASLRANLLGLFKKNAYDQYLVLLDKIAPKVQSEPSLHFLDRTLVNTVFSIFGAIRVHGEYNYMCLRLIYFSADDIDDVYTQLRPTLRRTLQHDKDAHAHEMLLMIVHRCLKSLSADATVELIPELVALFPRHPSLRCREIFYGILIWLWDNSEHLTELRAGAGAGAGAGAAAMSDAKSGGASAAGYRALQKLQSALLQGLSDESELIRDKLYAFWDNERRLDGDIGRRLVQCLSDLYEPEAESCWLHYATYLLLHPMRRSPDFTRPFSDKPLAEGAFKFEKTSIDTAWTFRSSAMQPLFSSTQSDTEAAAQSAAQDPATAALMEDDDDDKDGDAKYGGGARRGMVRSTQEGGDFSLSQSQRSFMDLDDKQMLHSAVDSQKTALLFRVAPSTQSLDAAAAAGGSLADFKKSGKRLRRVHGAERGGIKAVVNAAVERRVWVEGESVSRRFDSQREGTDEYMIQINSIKKRYKEIWAERQKQQRAAQVRLYRDYRKGELPDIMCPNKDLLLPLQHLTATDPVLARQLFLMLFGAVYKQLPQLYEEHTARALRQDVRMHLARVLASTGGTTASGGSGAPSSPAFVFALHLAHLTASNIEVEANAAAQAAAAAAAASDSKEAKGKRAAAEKKAPVSDTLPLYAWEIAPDRVGDTAYRSSNYHSGVVLLEHLLEHPSPANAAMVARAPKPKSGLDTTRDRVDDVWFELARLYRELGEADIVKSLFHKYARQNFTKEAIQASLNGEYERARQAYDTALDMIANRSEWPAGTVAPTQKEVNTWDDERLECLRHMVDWEALHENVCVDLDGDFDKLWEQTGAAQSHYMRYFVESSLKLDAKRAVLYDFVDRALKHSPERKSALIHNYAPELVMLFASRNDAPLARYYLARAYNNFLFQWTNLPVLARHPRAALLRGLQKLAEMNEFLSATRFATAANNMSAFAWDRTATECDHLITVWGRRYPSRVDPVHVWDDVLSNRAFFLKRITAQLAASAAPVGAAAAAAAAGSGGLVLTREAHARLQTLQQRVTSANVTGFLRAATAMAKSGNSLVAKVFIGRAGEENKLGRPTADDLFRVEFASHNLDFEVARDLSLTSGPNAAKTKVTEFWKLIRKVETLDRKTAAAAAADKKEAGAKGKAAEAPAQNPFLMQLLNGLQAKLYSELAALLQRNESLAALCDDEVSAESLYADAESCLSDVAVAFRQLLAKQSGAAAGSGGASSSSGAGGASGASAERQRTDRAAARAYMEFARFCERRLDEGLPEDDHMKGGSGLKREERLPADAEQKLVQAMTETVTDALLLGSAAARAKYPRVLDRVARSDRATRQLFLERTARVPPWMFLRWISQMLALLGLPDQVELVLPTLLRLARLYPQALIFPFNLSRETIEDLPAAPQTARAIEQLAGPLRSPLIDAFVQALDGLTNPELLFKDFRNKLLSTLGLPGGTASADVRAEARKVYLAFSESCLVSRKQHVGVHIGVANRAFASEKGKVLRDRLGAPGTEWPAKLTYDVTRKILGDVEATLKPIKHGPVRLVEHSEYLLKFEEITANTDQYIELPGQYTGACCPAPERHVRVVSFDPTLLVMSSLRKPKRLIVHANDERNYPFLIKGGEDLRQDARIQQLFGAMHDTLRGDPRCVARDLYVRTYQVFPMTRSVGMIEWLPNTTPLKGIITDQAKAARCPDPMTVLTQYNRWIVGRVGAKDFSPLLHIALLELVPEKEVVVEFERLQNLLRPDLLQRGVAALCSSPENFVVVRSRFARTFAAFTICAYVLGIGDRHLDNFLLDTGDGALVGIDFGVSFGAGIGLGVPELMPFRFTRQFQHFCRPLDTSALVKQDMTYTLSALKRNSEMLVTLMDVFIKEPQLDWIAAAKASSRLSAMNSAASAAPSPAPAAAGAVLGSGSAAPLSAAGAGAGSLASGAAGTSGSGGSGGGTGPESQVARYTRDKIRNAKRKLRGDNPATIMAAELQDTRLPYEKPKCSTQCTAYILGRGKLRGRNSWKQCVSVADQIDCLVDLATDPNILGRTWGGWMPFC